MSVGSKSKEKGVLHFWGSIEKRAVKIAMLDRLLLRSLSIAILSLAVPYQAAASECPYPAALLPTNVDGNTNCARLTVGRDKAECYFAVGHFYDQKGDRVRAIANYNKSIAVDPRIEHSPSRGSPPFEWCRPGDGPFDFYDPYFPAPKRFVDRQAARLPEIKAAIARDPRYAVVWMNLANNYFFNYRAQGLHTCCAHDPRGPQLDENLRLAIEAFDNAIRLDPNYEQAWLGRGDAYSNAGDLDQAINDYSEAIQLDHTSWYFLIKRGETYQRAGRFQQAMGDFNEVIKRRPDDPDSWMRRAHLYEAMGDQTKMNADYCQAGRLDVGNQKGMR